MSDAQTPPMAKPRVAAGALFFDDQNRVLLVQPTYKDGWDIPGGYVEPGETPIEACEREAKEELGSNRKVGRLLVVDWAPSTQEGDKILFIFDGGDLDVDAAGLALPVDELRAAAFHAPGTLHTLMPNRLALRLKEAVYARSTGHTTYLEHGRQTATTEA